MSYRAPLIRLLGTVASLFMVWVLLVPPLYGHFEEVAPQEGQPASENAPTPGTELQPTQPGGGGVTIESGIPADFNTARLEIDQESGDLARLPFDHPFTILLSLGALEVGDQDPSLRFMEFRKRLDVVPGTVCEGERQATFAGVTTASGSGGTTRKARFIMPALDPNRYLVICFKTTAQISAELSDSERQALASALRNALEGLETEFEARDFEGKRAQFRRAFEAALASFAQRQGLGGTLRMEGDFGLRDLQRDFLGVRQSMVPCNLETLRRHGQDFVGNARPQWESSVREIVGRSPERLDFASCRDLYETALEEAMTENADEAIVDNLLESKRELDSIDRQLDDLTKRAIRAVQTRNSLSLATTISATSVARRYVSADGGFAFIPHLDQSVTFTGVNVYLRPVNPPSVTPLGWGWKGLARRTSLTIGVTLNEDLVRKDTIGGVETKIVDDLTTVGSPLFGLGFRLNPALRLEAGAIAYKQLDTLISQTPKTEVNWYFALSLDMDVASLFTNGKNSFFNGGTPTP